jgi:two-component system LytT family response regulator
MSIRVLIVDDEPLARVGVAARLRDHADMTVIGECETGEQAIEAIASMKPDLVFLDIQMPGISGLELSRAIPRSVKPAVVFLTAHQQHALEAFDVQAIDYLLKPINDERFLLCLDRVREFVSLRQHESVDMLMEGMRGSYSGQNAAVTLVNRFALRTGQRVTFVLADEIDWIEGLGDYVGLHVMGKKHLLRQTMASLEAHLDRSKFLRIHRSTIVQVSRIARIKALPNRDSIITLQDGTSLRASRTYGKGLHELLQNGRLVTHNEHERRL